MRIIGVVILLLDILLCESVYTMGTRGAWSRDFLAALGNTSPSAKTINLVAAWTKAENTEARYNPLATTLNYGSNTLFNHLGVGGVRNYETRQQGIEATVRTLNGNFPGYAKVRDGLAKDNPELALDGMLTPLMPWGTNFGTVSKFYHSSDVTGEALRSEDGSSQSTHTTNKVDDTQYASGTTRPATTAEMLMTNGEVTADDVQRYAKIALGSVIGVVGFVLIIKSVLNIDTAKLATTAAKVAL